MATCNKRVGKGAVTFPCRVEIPVGATEHPGPCAAPENESSMVMREQWENPLRDARTGEVIEDTVLRTTADMLTENATAKPGFEGFPKDPKPWMPHVDRGERFVWVETLKGWRPFKIDSEIKEGLRFREDFTGNIVVHFSYDAALALGVIEGPIDGPTDDEFLSEAKAPVEPEAPRIDLDRAADEPPPTEGEGDMWAEIIEDMRARHQHGLEEYGTPLQRWNGRSAENDAYQEALDLVCYMHQMRTEREVIRSLVAVIYHSSGDTDAVAEAKESLARLLGVV